MASEGTVVPGRRAGRPIRRDRLRRSWRIFYRSGYGKVGFWILVVFAAVPLLSPVLILHDPVYFFAPTEDAYAPSQELAASLPFSVQSNGTPLAPAAVALSAVGSPVVYVTAADGRVTAVGLGASSTTTAGTLLPVDRPGLPADARVFPATVVPLANESAFVGSYSFAYGEYLVLGSTAGGTSRLEFARIQWTGPNGPGDGTPHATGIETTVLNGTLVAPPVTNAIASTELPSWGPFASAPSALPPGFQPAYIDTVTEGPGGFDLSEFSVVPLRLVWSVRLPGNETPSAPVPVGAFFTPPGGTLRTELLVAQGTSVLAYRPATGTLLWRTNFSAPVDARIGPVVPFADQVGTFHGSDVAFVALRGDPAELATVALGDGAPSVVTTVPAPIQGIGTSPGTSGYPSYLALVTATRAIFLRGPGAVADAADTLTLPAGFGPGAFSPVYDPSANLMLFTDRSGDALAVLPDLPQYPIAWTYLRHPAAANVSAPVLFENAATGRVSIAYVTSANEVDVLSTLGVDRNPLPPTLHAPSGNAYLLGTNSFGNDVWSQFVASFAWDWAVGLAVAAGIMLLALLVAMFVGYVGTWLGAIVEMVTLVLFLLPGLALLLVVAAIAGPSLLNVVLVLTLVGWPFTAFTLLGVVRSVKTRTFVDAARVSGAGTLQILRRHMLPSMTPLLAYLTALTIGASVTALSTLQFLGIAPLTIPTWGGMLQPILGNYFLAVQAPWWVGPPTIALTLFVFAFVFVSRGLDEVVAPRLRRR